MQNYNVFIHMLFILYMRRRIKTQDAKCSSKAALLRISRQCDYHQSYAGAQGAKPMKMVLIRKLVFMVTGSHCAVTYAKRATCVCVCVCQQTFWDCPLSLHCQSHKMVANRRHRFHGGQ